MASKKKKIVTKDDLRRLMKEKQSVTKSATKKVEHPLAKYNSLNQLVCVLCNNVIKTDLLWTAHIQSKPHKEKLEAIKQSKTGNNVGPKRKAPDRNDEDILKKFRGDSNGNKQGQSVPADFFDNGKKPGGFKTPAQPKSILVNSSKKLVTGYDGSDSDSGGEEAGPSHASGTTSTASTSALDKGKLSSGLPADFFDSGVMPSASLSTEDDSEERKPAVMAEVLPEGFFDDPKQDAKVRQVEYVDKMEEEWELFQKSMKEEAHVSEAIIEEEDEQVNVDRNIDEIDEQMQRWKEVNDLETKKEELMKNGPVDTRTDGDSDENLNEEDLQEFLDWRSKKSWR